MRFPGSSVTSRIMPADFLSCSRGAGLLKAEELEHPFEITGWLGGHQLRTAAFSRWRQISSALVSQYRLKNQLAMINIEYYQTCLECALDCFHSDMRFDYNRVRRFPERWNPTIHIDSSTLFAKSWSSITCCWTIRRFSLKTSGEFGSAFWWRRSCWFVCERNGCCWWGPGPKVVPNVFWSEYEGIACDWGGKLEDPESMLRVEGRGSIDYVIRSLTNISWVLSVMITVISFLF